MSNCLLCGNCYDNSDSVDGHRVYTAYGCNVKEDRNGDWEDSRFPYKNTKCEDFIKDTSAISLAVKQIPKEIWHKVTWEID